MSIRISLASEKDAEHIVGIGVQSFYDAFAQLFQSEEDLKNYLERTYDVKRIRHSISKENNVFFIAWEDGKPVGFAKVKKFSLNPQFESVAQMELQKIYVLFEHHGSGAGAALMNSVIDLAKQLAPDLLWLDVHITNSRAIRFYEKHNFKRSGKHYFTIGSQTFEYDLMTLLIKKTEKIINKNPFHGKSSNYFNQEDQTFQNR